MSHPVLDAALPAAIAALETALAAWGETTKHADASKDYPSWRLAHARADEALRGALGVAGAKVREDYRGSAVRLAGINATSTGGLNGAARNWLTAARKRTPA